MCELIQYKGKSASLSGTLRAAHQNRNDLGKSPDIHVEHPAAGSLASLQQWQRVRAVGEYVPRNVSSAFYKCQWIIAGAERLNSSVKRLTRVVAHAAGFELLPGTARTPIVSRWFALLKRKQGIR